MVKYLTFETSNKPICEIKDNKTFKKNKIIYLDSDGESHNLFNQLKIKEGSLQLIPNKNTERSILYIAGQSGSGKTYFLGQYLKEYKKLFPDNEIYIFSSVPKGDISLDGVELNYIELESLLEEDLTTYDFENSFVVFDDTDCITNKKVREAVRKIQNSVLEVGRHTKTYCALTNHQLYDGVVTKKVLNESTSITIFPLTLGNRSLKYLLDNYLGLSKEEIQNIKKLKSRSVTFIKSYPKLVLSSKELYVLGANDSGTDSESEVEEAIKYEKKIKSKNKKYK